MTRPAMPIPTWPCVIGTFKGFAPIYQGEIDGTIYMVEFVYGGGWYGFQNLKGPGSWAQRVGPFDTPQEAAAALSKYALEASK